MVLTHTVAGSELCMAVDAAKELEGSGKKVRVVSFPCWELFDEQEQVNSSLIRIFNMQDINTCEMSSTTPLSVASSVIAALKRPCSGSPPIGFAD